MIELEPIRDLRNPSIICGWHDRGRGCDFRRIWGAIAWPNPAFDRPGFAVVAGERFDEPRCAGWRFGPHHPAVQAEAPIYVLAEAENSNFTELMDRCVEFGGVVASWCSAPLDMAVAGLLQRYNDRQRSAGRPVLPFPFTAPLVTAEGGLEEAFRYGIAAIRDRAKRGTLNIKECPLISRCLPSIKPGEPSGFEEFPAFVALCLAVVALDRIPYVHPVTAKKPAFALSEYDPLGSDRMFFD